MVYSIDFEELAGKIKHIETAKYLRDLGWNELPTKVDSVQVFQLKNDDGFFQVNLPTSRELRDYNWAMFKTAETIARFSKKSVEQVLLELINPLSDILRLRIHDESASSGSLSLDDGVKLYENAKKLLTAAAMDVERPQAFHAGGRPPSGIADFISLCRFGQTEIGSYVVSVVCPFAHLKPGNFEKNEMVQLSLYDDTSVCAESLTRKTVNKVISSVNIVKEAVQQGNLDKIAESGISANFLDALSNINIYRENSTLDLTVKYAPTISLNAPHSNTVSIDHEYHAPINTLINKIKRTGT